MHNSTSEEYCIDRLLYIVLIIEGYTSDQARIRRQNIGCRENPTMLILKDIRSIICVTDY
jgi:hypothetical protein